MGTPVGARLVCAEAGDAQQKWDEAQQHTKKNSSESQQKTK
jgi:hypothetical protein